MKKIITLICSFCLFFLLTVGITYAWVGGSGLKSDLGIESSIHKSYFESGDGTTSKQFIDDPTGTDAGCAFEIKYPVQLYYLAWLQELGYFNQITNGSVATTYFYLSSDLDMTEYVLPPIGTSTYPFTGNFDGNGHTITNLKVQNKNSELTDTPETLSYITEIIGMFGVVGSLNSDGKTTGSVAEGEMFKPIQGQTYSYDAEENKISDFVLNNTTIITSTDRSLMGIVAGYCDALITDVKVGTNVSIERASNTTSNVTNVDTTYLSAYTVLGYVTNDYTKTSDVVFVSIDSPTGSSEKYNYSAQGDSSGWGGSIGMDELYKRIQTLQNSNLKTQDKYVKTEYHYYNNGIEDLSKYEETYTNVNSYEYFDETNDLIGRVIYGQAQANYLWGVRTYTYTKTITNEYHNDDDPIYYYASGTNKGTTYYLSCTGSIGTTTSKSNITKLFIDNDGWVYYEYNNKIYYLYATSSTNNTLTTSTTKQNYMFTISGSALRLRRNNANRTLYDRYVSFNKNSFNISGTSTNILTQDIDFKTEIIDETVTFETNGTYLPLNIYTSAADIPTDSDIDLVVNGARLNNTGYIIGGTKDMSDNYGSAVRVASNYDYGDLSRALGGASSYSGSNLQILTRTKDSNGVTFINDNYNNGVALTTNLTSLSYVNNKQKVNVADLGLKAYTQARNNLDTQFKANTSTLYVLRFNEFQISLDRTITAEKVLLNGEVKTNYVFPESCIDFSVKDKGYISFFGGGFRGGSCNAFFSLYHIVRDENDNITSLKHLSKIYGNGHGKDSYIYEYDDNGVKSYSIYDRESKTYKSTSLLSGYTVYFDLLWVERPGFTAVDNTCWYFEIPVNEGEYALGAVDGRTGAYMFYLDVGTNAQVVERTTVVENIEETVGSYVFPDGITFKNDSSEYLNAALAASMSFSSTSYAITVDPSGNPLNMSNITYKDGTTDKKLDPTGGRSPDSTVVTKIKRISYFDFCQSDERYTITEVTLKKVGDETTTITISAWQATYEEGVWTKGEQFVTDQTISTSEMEAYYADGSTTIVDYWLYTVEDYETLRFDGDAFDDFDDISNITNELNNFNYAIDKNDGIEGEYDPTNISYDFSVNIVPEDTEDVTLGNITYDVTIKTSQYIVISDVDGSGTCTVTQDTTTE